MRVLVTGGTGVIGESTVRALHRKGHAVRVLTRHASRDSARWPNGVEVWDGDITDEASIRGAAAACDAVLHVAGIAEEKPPDATFQSVNIDGTRGVLMEAERAGVKRVVYVSSLGADRGKSGYHRSKYLAEDFVRGFSGEWVVVRPGAVYGPGDEHISVLLRMVCSLPVIPTIGGGDQQFQPVWHEDVAKALAACVERDEVADRVLEIAGPDMTSQNDLVRRLRRITGREAIQAPVPAALTAWGLKALDALGVEVPFTEQQLAMLTEGNFIRAGGLNALSGVLGFTPTSLDDGLSRLVNEQPEQHPSEGVGSLTKKRYWVDIRGGRLTAAELFEQLCLHFGDLMPATVRVVSDSSGPPRVEEGATLTLEVPVRGQIQVRVVERTDHRMSFLTVAGHPIAGAVRFFTATQGDAVHFEIQAFDRAASRIDQVMLRTVGGLLQRETWTGLAENVAKLAGGSASAVEMDEQKLNDADVAVVDDWAKTLSAQLSRNSTSSGRD